MRQKVWIRAFRCTECGQKNYAPKRKKYLTSNGHIKDMYCPYCGRITKFEQMEVK